MTKKKHINLVQRPSRLTSAPVTNTLSKKSSKRDLPCKAGRLNPCAQEKPISATATSFCVTERHFCLALTSRHYRGLHACGVRSYPYPQVTSQPARTGLIVRSRQSRRLYRSGALLYWKNAWCKVKIGVAKGKKQHDKRSDIKEREWQVDKARIMKNAHR